MRILYEKFGDLSRTFYRLGENNTATELVIAIQATIKVIRAIHFLIVNNRINNQQIRREPQHFYDKIHSSLQNHVSLLV